MKKIKGIQIEKEEFKIIQFAHDMIIYKSDSKNSNRAHLHLINTLSIVAGYEINFKKSVVLLDINYRWASKEFKELKPTTIGSNNVKYFG